MNYLDYQRHDDRSPERVLRDRYREHMEVRDNHQRNAKVWDQRGNRTFAKESRELAAREEAAANAVIKEIERMGYTIMALEVLE